MNRAVIETSAPCPPLRGANLGWRIARLEEADLEGVIPIHLEAFAGYMNASLGKRYARAFLGWFTRRTDAIALKALGQGDCIAGYAVGAPLSAGRALSLGLAGTVLGCMAARPWLLLSPRIQKAIIGRVRVMISGRQAEGDVCCESGTISLTGIGVAPEARGQGIGELLLMAFEARARDLGMRRLRLSVYPENAAARGLYEKCGWTAAECASGPGASMRYSKIIRMDEWSEAGAGRLHLPQA
jgi:ribosomal protein S18 acetylase RimI-like enzyme